MAELTLQPDSALPEVMPKKKSGSAVARVLRYVLMRIVTLFVTVIVGVYLTILIANMGGYVDNIQRAQIREEIQQQFLNNPAFKSLSQEEKNQRMADLVTLREKRVGLDQPFALFDECPHSQPGLDTKHDQRQRLKAGAQHHAGALAAYPVIVRHFEHFAVLREHLCGIIAFAALWQHGR
jgi:hypothetical protein